MPLESSSTPLVAVFVPSTDAIPGSAVFLDASLVAAISSFAGRCFLSTVFGGIGIVLCFGSFDEATAAVMLVPASSVKSTALLVSAFGAAGVVVGCSGIMFSSSGWTSFATMVDRADDVGRTGTTGLIVTPLAAFRCERGGAGGGAEGATRGGKS